MKLTNINIFKLIIFLNIIIIISPSIDTIIRLGNDYFRYITFATNLNGDMIIITSSTDSSSYPERRLFGLKRKESFISKMMMIKRLLLFH